MLFQARDLISLDDKFNLQLNTSSFLKAIIWTYIYIDIYKLPHNIEIQTTHTESF